MMLSQMTDNRPISICYSPDGKLMMLDTDGNIWEWSTMYHGWYCMIEKSKTLETINK